MDDPVTPWRAIRQAVGRSDHDPIHAVAAELSDDRVIVYVEATETEWIQADHPAPVAECR